MSFTKQACIKALGMDVWRKYGPAPNVRERTEEQCAWDSGVLAASELARRITGDEQLAYDLHLMLTKEHPGPPTTPSP